MEIIYLQKIAEVKKEQQMLEEKLNIKMFIKGKQVTISGESLDEYEASVVFEAISFGFSIQTALLLKSEDFMFRRINIKHVTNRKNLEIVKARVIGTHGKVRRALEQLADCRIIIMGNEIGIIGPTEDMEEATTGVESLIRGSKQSNVYNYLEKRNKERKEQKWNAR